VGDLAKLRVLEGGSDQVGKKTQGGMESSGKGPSSAFV